MAYKKNNNTGVMEYVPDDGTTQDSFIANTIKRKRTAFNSPVAGVGSPYSTEPQKVTDEAGVEEEVPYGKLAEFDMPEDIYTYDPSSFAAAFADYSKAHLNNQSLYDFQLNGTQNQWYDMVNDDTMSQWYYQPYGIEADNRESFNNWWEPTKAANEIGKAFDSAGNYTRIAGTDPTAWSEFNKGYAQDVEYKEYENPNTGEKKEFATFDGKVSTKDINLDDVNLYAVNQYLENAANEGLLNPETQAGDIQSAKGYGTKDFLPTAQQTLSPEDLNWLYTPYQEVEFATEEDETKGSGEGIQHTWLYENAPLDNVFPENLKTNTAFGNTDITLEPTNVYGTKENPDLGSETGAGYAAMLGDQYAVRKLWDKTDEGWVPIVDPYQMIQEEKTKQVEEASEEVGGVVGEPEVGTSIESPSALVNLSTEALALSENPWNQALSTTASKLPVLGKFAPAVAPVALVADAAYSPDVTAPTGSVAVEDGYYEPYNAGGHAVNPNMSTNPLGVPYNDTPFSVENNVGPYGINRALDYFGKPTDYNMTPDEYAGLASPTIQATIGEGTGRDELDIVYEGNQYQDTSGGGFFGLGTGIPGMPSYLWDSTNPKREEWARDKYQYLKDDGTLTDEEFEDFLVNRLGTTSDRATLLKPMSVADSIKYAKEEPNKMEQWGLFFDNMPIIGDIRSAARSGEATVNPDSKYDSWFLDYYNQGGGYTVTPYVDSSYAAFSLPGRTRAEQLSKANYPTGLSAYSTVFDMPFESYARLAQRSQ